MIRYSFLLLVFFLMVGCSDDRKLFKYRSPRATGISFNNEIPDNEIFNILSFEYIYNGGGVASGDFNKDGLQDLFFVGNAVDNKLYLNQGKFYFKSIKNSDHIAATGKWCTGVNVVDINNDGWPDIYVGVNSFNTNEVPNNLLFVHQGLDDQGEPAFKEMASSYGIEGGKHTMHSAFFDYDLDGDLDLYLLNNVLDLMSPTDYRDKQLDGEAPNSDQLFRNEGNNTFIEVTKEAGIVIEGYGLGLAISDINEDGYPDVYVANDYVTNDMMYINQKDGTFRNEIAQRLKKQSKFSMGVSTRDLNNDGRNEIFVLDMLAYNNERLKKLNGSSQYNNIVNNRKYSYEEQNVRNMLQVNEGDGTFTEIAYQAGVHASDWSWTPLTADFDNDGDLDIYVTNGFPKDVTDLDFINFKANRNMSANRKEILNEIPEIKIPNQFFINNGDLSFTEVSSHIGLNRSSFSNGAIAVDLDNDGDLDIVTNNINEPAYIIENKSRRKASLQVSFQNSELIGTKIYYYHGDTIQYREYFPHQSYLSSAPSTLFFSSRKVADSVRLIYPDLKSELIQGSTLKPTLTLEKSKGKPITYTARNPSAIRYERENKSAPYFDASIQTSILTDYSHNLPRLIKTNEDYEVIDGSPLVLKNTTIENVTNGVQLDPYTMLYTTASYQNPSEDQTLFTVSKGELIDSDFNKIQGQVSILKIGDVNNDGYNDLLLGGGYKYGQYPDHHPHYLAIQNSSGSYRFQELDHDFAILDAEWVDVDDDGFLDLLVTGHWQSVSIFKNNAGELSSKSEVFLENIPSGLYFSLETTDLNKDGRQDIVLGNLGNNTQFRNSPVQMLVDDFDENGTLDPLVFFSYGRSDALVPLDLKDEIITQVPLFKKKYIDYSTFTNATIDSFKTEKSVVYSADDLHSIVLLSEENNYKIQALPIEVQRAPVLVIEAMGDTLFMGGNISYGREFWGSYSASNGHWFQWLNGELKNISNQFPKIPGDIRSAIKVDDRLVIGRNGDEIVVIK